MTRVEIKTRTYGYVVRQKEGYPEEKVEFDIHQDTMIKGDKEVVIAVASLELGKQLQHPSMLKLPGA